MICQIQSTFTVMILQLPVLIKKLKLMKNPEYLKYEAIVLGYGQLEILSKSFDASNFHLELRGLVEYLKSMKNFRVYFCLIPPALDHNHDMNF